MFNINNITCDGLKAFNIYGTKMVRMLVFMVTYTYVHVSCFRDQTFSPSYAYTHNSYYILCMYLDKDIQTNI